MSSKDRRLVLDQNFERAVATVLTAFLDEGFSIESVEGGDLHHQGAPIERLRYAQLEATLPELKFVPSACGRGLPAILACRISLFELPGTCTLVTASSPLQRYPTLASLMPRLSDRLGGALHAVVCRGTDLQAA